MRTHWVASPAPLSSHPHTRSSQAAHASNARADATHQRGGVRFMSQAAGSGFIQLAKSSRVPPNAALRLLQREIWGHRSSTAVHTARAFSECILPTHKVVDSESPDVHIGRFTQAGDALVCFTPQLDALVLFDYLGPVPQQQQQQQQGHDARSSICFHRFFRERWRLVLCPDAAEQLSRDFCVDLRDGAFLLLASTTQQRREGAGAAAGAPDAAAAAPTAAAGGGTGDQQRAGLDPAAATAAAAGGGGGGDGRSGSEEQPDTAQRRMPSSDCADMTTFHVVDVRRCIKVDERRFPADHFDLSGNGCVSLYDNIMSLTSIRTQTIHLLQVNRDGSLLDIQHIGRDCRPDDDVPVQLAAAAEQQWQLAKQQERQQQQFWVHQQARALLPARHRPAGPQQQQQRHASPVVAPSGASGSLAQALPAATAATDGRQQRRRRRGSSSNDDGESGDASGDASDDSMDRGRRRRVRRRVEPGQQQQQQAQQVQGQAPAAAAAAPARAATQAAGAIAAQAPRPQAAGPALAQPQPPTAAAGGAAAAAAATAAAVLDPGSQLIQGLRQRLLAHLLKAAAGMAPCDVAPTQWDFQHNFGVLSSLVVWRARLLGRHRLLLKFGAPTSGTAAAAELNPSRVHFYGVYDTRSTRFSGFWKAGSLVLLAVALERSCALLTAKPNLSPWERCCAAALYPQGVPIGLEQQQQAGQQQQGQQQQQADGGAAPQAVTTSRPRSISSHGGGADAGEAAAGGSSRRRRSSAQGSAAAGGPPAVAAVAADGGAGTNAPAAAAGAEPPTGAGVPRGTAGGSGSSKAARERLKVLRQVVLLVLPGLQSLCPSPYLDPRLFSYSKQISPIIGLRNSPSQPLRFQLARRYAGFQPGPAAVVVAQDPAVAAGAAAAEALQSGQAGSSSQPGQQQQQHHDVLQLDAAQPPVVRYQGEDVARRQLYLLHPSDPFVLVVVQTIAQPAVLNIYHRV